MYYVVDEQGRNVFELGKTGRVWGVLWPMTADDFEQVEYADPYWREDAEALGPSVARWVREVCGARVVTIHYDGMYEDACEPWWVPHPKYPSLHAMPPVVADGWTLWTPYDEAGPHRALWRRWPPVKVLR
jgi:hypothetical protein